MKLTPNIRDSIQRIMVDIPHLIHQDQNESLMREITYSKVEKISMDIPHNKVLGLDEFTKYLFKARWKFIGLEVHDLVEYSRQTQKIWSSLGAIFIPLIPKSGKLEDPSGFHPIALCNSI